ncbi:regulator of microtubule dynamics protein 1 isoform X2 [Gadus morhua]|uniref:regulator of microtubule dynamics protein 1 isoform X2 n=1 Tax=Gadus morhua TaxID=8049 RepID=UPI0011B66F8D|nr:regulator of microtubule dynamics protein 1 isoform X2 [Gadus morhua]XP_056439757.1 regulator of microtubule dynamics protein 1-like isoform X2 [Gadus chalcogrammus]XP_059901829.1 regulator of microtubule dynamics protein 1 isoform X2 [Gadus macrocephalus]
MTGTLLMRFLTRSLLSGNPIIRSRGVASFIWTTAKRTNAFLISGRVAFCLGLPTVCYLGHEAYRGIHSAAVVFALEKEEEIIEQADYLHSCAETEKLYQLLQQYNNSNDVEFLWRLARATRDRAMVQGVPADQKKALVYEAFGYAEKALEKDDACFASHKWYGILLSDLGDYMGTKHKLEKSLVIRKHLERAKELNPNDPTTVYILGYWCFSFAELSWSLRKLATVIFGTPPTSSYEEALEFFLKAEEVKPGFYSKNLLMLGKTYLALKDKENAHLWLTKARDYRPITTEDKEVHQEAVQLLKRLG